MLLTSSVLVASCAGGFGPEGAKITVGSEAKAGDRVKFSQVVDGGTVPRTWEEDIAVCSSGEGLCATTGFAGPEYEIKNGVFFVPGNTDCASLQYELVQAGATTGSGLESAVCP